MSMGIYGHVFMQIGHMQRPEEDIEYTLSIYHLATTTL